RRLLVRARDANDVRPRLFQSADLVDGRPGVRCRRVGHRLDGDRRIAAHLDATDTDLARNAPRNRAAGADVVDVVAHRLGPGLVGLWRHVALLLWLVKATADRQRVARLHKSTGKAAPTGRGRRQAPDRASAEQPAPRK